jgi:hypothetical protein
MGPRAGLDGCGKYRPPPPPTGIRSPNRPARSESLYRVSYPGPPDKMEYTVKISSSATSGGSYSHTFPSSNPVVVTFQDPPSRPQPL